MDVEGAVPPGGTPQPRQSISSLVFIIFFTIFLLSGNGEDPNKQLEMRDTLRSLTYQYSNYTSWLNGTESNFTLVPESPSLPPLLNSVLPFHPAIDPYADSYYKNVTGFLKGSARFHNLTLPSTTTWHSLAEVYISDINITDAVNKTESTWNWTRIDKASLNIREAVMASVEDMSSFRGALSLENEEGEIKFVLDGIHLVKNGTFYALAEPFGTSPDFRQLSALLPGDLQNATAHAIQAELEKRLSKFRTAVEEGFSEDDPLDINAETSCPFHLYGQIVPSTIPQYYMDELESEMENPTGVTTVSRPPIAFEGVFVSRECGILIEIRDAVGLRWEADRFWRKATTYAGFASIAYLVILLLLVQQMESSRTPTGISKISRWCFALQAVTDAYSFVAHVTIGVVSNNRASLSLMAPGFLAATLFLVFEVRFATLIHRIQAPEDSVTDTPALQRPPPPTTPLPTSETATATPAAPAVPAPAPAQTRITRLRRVLRRITDPDSKFWLILLLALLGLVQLTLSPQFVFFALFLLHSFWVPQIYRNARRHTRKALSKSYVIGTSISRLYFVLYIYACPNNVMFTEMNNGVWLFVGWLWLQVLVLVAQEYLGPAFFLPKSWIAVQLYDYHPVMPLADPEAPEQSLGDCAICMEPIVVHVHQDGEKAVSGGSLMSLAVRRTYSLAPCGHLFHTACLERWLAIKSICPQCRRPLPSF